MRTSIKDLYGFPPTKVPTNKPPSCPEIDEHWEEDNISLSYPFCPKTLRFGGGDGTNHSGCAYIVCGEELRLLMETSQRPSYDSSLGHDAKDFQPTVEVGEESFRQVNPIKKRHMSTTIE